MRYKQATLWEGGRWNLQIMNSMQITPHPI
jgi:hypothetical protein